MFGGPWDSTLNMMGVPSLKLGVPSFYISFKFWKVVYPSVKAQCCPQVSNFEGYVWPILIFFFGGGGAFEIFEGHILPSVKHNPIRFFFTKAELVPIIYRDQASP